MLVFRGDFVLQDVQLILIVEVEYLRDDAHAHPVAFAQAEVDYDLLCHLKTFTGTWW